MSLFLVLDIMGTVAFAISGALSAMHRKLDPFGIVIIAFVTALGGGTLRDVLIGNTPVNWMQHPITIFYVFLAVCVAILTRNKIHYLKKSLFLFDTIGLGIFTIIGIELGIRNNLSPVISIILGVLTGCFGGVIRDILCNEIPVLFRKEIYAIASLIGAICFVLLQELKLAQNFIYIATILLIIAIRIWALLYKITLPKFEFNAKNS